MAFQGGCAALGSWDTQVQRPGPLRTRQRPEVFLDLSLQPPQQHPRCPPRGTGPSLGQGAPQGHLSTGDITCLDICVRFTSEGSVGPSRTPQSPATFEVCPTGHASRPAATVDASSPTADPRPGAEPPLRLGDLRGSQGRP